LPQRLKRMLQKFLSNEEKVYALINRSFLNETTKKKYTDLYNDKRRRISQSLTELL
jgi:hypothetical protein